MQITSLFFCGFVVKIHKKYYKNFTWFLIELIEHLVKREYNKKALVGENIFDETIRGEGEHMKRKHRKQMWAFLLTLFMLISTIAGDMSFVTTAYAAEVENTLTTESEEDVPSLEADGEDAAMQSDAAEPVEAVQAEPTEDAAEGLQTEAAMLSVGAARAAVDTSDITAISTMKAEANTSKTYTVKGTVTSVSGKNVYMEDGTGGVCLYLSANAGSIVAGNVITAAGTYANFQNLIELSGVVEADCIVEAGTGDIPCTTRTIAEIMADAPTTGAIQGTRVKVENAVLGETSGNYTPVTQNVDGVESTVNLFKATLPDSVKAGDKVDIVGIVGCYNNAQLVGVTTGDVTLKETAAHMVEASVAVGAVKAGTQVALSCQTEGAAIYYNTDGSGNYTEYTAPIVINAETTIYAYAKKDGYKDSLTASFVYTIADAGNLKTVAALAKTVNDGDEVVLYCPNGSALLTDTASGKKLTGVAAASAADEIVLSDDAVANAAVMTVSKDAEGNYTFISKGKYLTSQPTGNGVSFADAASDYSLWTLVPANDKGLFYVKNVNAAYNGNAQSLEYFNGFTTYGHKDNEVYQFQFYTLSEKEVATPVVTNGTYVIYNPANGKALSSVYSGNYNSGVDYTLNTSNSFDKVKATEVWNIESKADGSVIISQNGNRLSMGASYASTPLNDVNDTWNLIANEDATYYIENVGRGSKIEWYAAKNNFSTYTGTGDLYKMRLIPVTESQIEEDAQAPVRTQAIANGAYFIYSSSAAGVMKYDLTGGVAAAVPATVANGNKADFGEGTGEGAGVYTFEWQDKTQTYTIKLGNKYVGANNNKEIILTDKASTANGSYWIIEGNEEFGGYTIANSSIQSASNPYYFEYYGSKGFCLYTASAITEIYTFSFLDASGVANDGGYVGTKPTPGELPEDGKSYVIFNASGKSVVGPEVEPIDGASASMGAANATKHADGSLDVANGGLIFDVTKEGSYYIFKNNGKYLATNDDEELFLQDALDDYARWGLDDLSGGFLMKNKAANWNGTPVVLEYFSGGFAGYTYKATDADIFRFEFHECADTYGTGYVVAPAVVFQTDAVANWGVDYTMKFTLDDLGTIQSVTAQTVFEDGTTKNYSPAMTEYDGTVTIPAADLQGHTSAKLTISVISKESATKNAEYSGIANIAIKDEPVITAVSPAANVQTGSDKRPIVKVSFANIGENATAVMTLNGTPVALTLEAAESAYTYTPAADMEDGKYTAVVTITRADSKVVTKTWSFFVGTQGVSLYFGQIHSHTAEYSDGSGTLEQAYEYAMDKAADTDYMIVTDHSNYFDTTASATKDSIYDDAAESITKSSTVGADGQVLNLWQEAKATADYYDGLRTDFVAGYGYEMTWSGGPGHINVFNSKGIVSRNNTELNNKTNNAGMLAFYDLMVDADEKNATSTGTGNIIAQFNHPGTTFGYFDSFTGWEESRDSIMNLIEVGNGDGAIGGTAYFPSYEYYDMCLTAGWHVAPTNGQDNHKGSWGDSNTARTVVLTDTFTEEGIYEAMSARHIYSTEDQNLSVLYYLDETLQGGVIDGYDKDTVELAVSIADADSEDLGYVYVIGENGAVLYTSDYLTGNTADLSITLNNTSAYYYVKVVEKDGDIAVTAPVWVDDVNSSRAKVKLTLTGASESTGAYPVEGTKEALALCLNNNEETDITIVNYSLAVDGETVTSQTVNQTVVSGAKYETSYDWTPASYGTHKVVASMVITVAGETSTVTVTKNIYVAGTDYNTVRTVAEAKAGTERQEFTIEGYVTANASGYDQNTAFFDCIYVQDDTAGINVFPVAGDFRVGQKVRIHGAITYYNGEIELNISDDYGGYIQIIDANAAEVTPKNVTCREAMAEENIGLLMQVTGTVTRIHEASGVIDRIYVRDESGEEACVYINGYIWNSVTRDYNFGNAGTSVKLGDKVSVIGLGSVDVDELGEVEYLHRLRVRDRAEINVVQEPVSGDIIPDGDTSGGDTSGGDTSGGDISGGGTSGGQGATGITYTPTEGAVLLYDGRSTTESSFVNAENKIIRRLHNGRLVVEGSEDVLPYGSKIFVSLLSAGSVADNAKNIVESKLAGLIGYVIYEIDLLKADGTKLEQLDDYVTITMPIPAGLSIGDGQKLVVYRVESDGSLTRLETTVNGDTVTFKTNHFSTYVFAVQNASAVAPTTGDTNANIILFALLMLVMGSAIVAGESKKRRAH